MSKSSANARPLVEEETIKAQSRRLRGTIATGLTDLVTGALSETDTKLLKFHGAYQQDDRDLRLERQGQRLEPAYEFMVRVRMPGGVCTPAQWQGLTGLARERGNGTLRITTRQTFQFHGVLKVDLKPLMADLNALGLDSIAACGDVNRNVICHNHPATSPVFREIRALATDLSAALLPRTAAYRETWLDEPPAEGAGAEEEPLYGPTYLPRKFKIGIAVPPVNDVDVLAQDLGLIAIVEEGGLVGFNVAVGGGMGASHGDRATYPRLADVIGFCAPDQVLAVAEQVMRIQRDHGDRTNRRHARLKYTLDDRGVAWFKAELEDRLGFALKPPRDTHFDSRNDRFGWVEDDEGRLHLTLRVLAGRLQDEAECRRLTALAEVARIHDGDFRLTPNQNLTISGVRPGRKAVIEAVLARHGVPIAAEPEEGVRRHAIACVSLPTCGLAMAEAERALPGFLERLEGVLRPLGLSGEPISVRVSGCPNGCARPRLAEIGLVGKSLGRYVLYLGGGFAGERLNTAYRENLTLDEVIAALTPLLADYAVHREPAERFGDFVIRAGYLTAPDLSGNPSTTQEMPL